MTFIVYALSDPRTGEVRYVGKTHRDLAQRLKDHLVPSKLRAHTHKNCWLKQLKSLGLAPVIETVEENADDGAEEFWISQFRALGFNLTNATDGGEGTKGHKRPPRSPEHRARLSASLKGRTISPEWRKKLSDANKGKPKEPFTVAHREAISRAMRAIHRHT